MYPLSGPEHFLSAAEIVFYSSRAQKKRQKVELFSSLAEGRKARRQNDATLILGEVERILVTAILTFEDPH